MIGIKTGTPTAADALVVGAGDQLHRFALPTSFRPGQVPTKLTVHTPTKTFTVKLIKQ